MLGDYFGHYFSLNIDLFEVIYISPLHTNLQVVNVQSRKLVHVPGVHCHVCASSTSGCAFVYFTVQYCIEYSSTVSLFQAQDVQKQA